MTMTVLYLIVYLYYISFTVVSVSTLGLVGILLTLPSMESEYIIIVSVIVSVSTLGVVGILLTLPSMESEYIIIVSVIFEYSVLRKLHCPALVL